MDDVARMSARDLGDLFGETARRKGIPTEIVEKDFWVCWILKRLFASSRCPYRFIFKGGTSLSKAYGAIDRFSEDVDLSMNREDLGYGQENPLVAASGKQARKRIDALVLKCREAVRRSLVPALYQAIQDELGAFEHRWNLQIDPLDPQVVLFQYPRAELFSTQLAPYLHPVVRLEIGARSDHWPTEIATVRAYAAEEFIDLFREGGIEVVVLTKSRTFWEKVTILHALHHLPSEKSFPERMSRHYYDVFRLANAADSEGMIGQTELLLAVVAHKRLFFKSAWANYDSAVPGSIRLLPSRDTRHQVSRDYESMQEMIFGTPPAWDEICDVLLVTEKRVNQR
ncbi:MAG: nucleotidyl transferase AbiEii/AbiGii toxin family protein [Pirellulaceae bacterium]